MSAKPALAEIKLAPVRGADQRRSVSLIVPFLDEALCLPRLLDALAAFTHTAEARWPVRFDAIFVDDGSTDGGGEALAEQARLHPTGLDVRVLRLSRNFGKEVALTAGLMAANADAVVLMDADGQHPVETVDAFLHGWLEEGYDVVYGFQQRERPEGYLKAWARRAFYRLISATSDISIPPHSGDFRLMSRRAYEALRQLGEQQRLMKGLYSWIGFKQKGVAYRLPERALGGTKYSPRSLMKLGVEGVTSFSIAPLRLAIWVGVVLAILAGGYGAFSVFEALVFGIRTPGYPTLIVAVSMIGAAQLIFLGVIGEYLGKVLMEVKRRPLFIVESDQRLPGRGRSEAAEN